MLPGIGGNFFLIRRNCDFGAPQEPAFEVIVVSAGMTCRHYETHSVRDQRVEKSLLFGVMFFKVSICGSSGPSSGYGRGFEAHAP